jgi:hypothetical protein
MAENRTIAELLLAEAITSDEIDAAVDALLAKPDVGLYPVGGGYLLDLAAAVRAHPFSHAALSGGDASPSRKRKAARTAILLARAEHK